MEGPGSKRLAAYVLAGGESSRFGRDKARVELGGKPLLLRMEALAAHMSDATEIIAPEDRYQDLHVKCIPDRWPGAGPLGGITTALLHTAEKMPSCPWNLILGCDLPFLTSEWIVYLTQRASQSRTQAVVPRTANGFEPLCACYRTEARSVLTAAIERGVRKVMDAVEELEPEVLDEADWKRFDNSGRLFWNMNTPAEYEAARAAWNKLQQ